MAEKALPLPHRVRVAKAAAAAAAADVGGAKGAVKGCRLAATEGARAAETLDFGQRGEGSNPIFLQRGVCKASLWLEPKAKPPTCGSGGNRSGRRVGELRRCGVTVPADQRHFKARTRALRARADESRDRAPYRHSWSRTAPRQWRKSYLSPPNGFIVALSLNSAGGSISKARRFPSCCS